MAITVDSVRSPHFTVNQETVSRKGGSKYELCVICSKPVKNEKFFLHLHDGGSAIVTEAEAAERNAAGNQMADLACHPVGSDCAKKPELKPYLIKMGA